MSRDPRRSMNGSADDDEPEHARGADEEARAVDAEQLLRGGAHDGVHGQEVPGRQRARRRGEPRVGRRARAGARRRSRASGRPRARPSSPRPGARRSPGRAGSSRPSAVSARAGGLARRKKRCAPTTRVTHAGQHRDVEPEGVRERARGDLLAAAHEAVQPPADERDVAGELAADARVACTPSRSTAAPRR